jgi:hypothetical protein
MKKAVMRQWVTALRSGQFKQSAGWLESENGYCCLGVLCNLAIAQGVCDYEIEYNKDHFKMISRFDGHSADLPLSVVYWAGVESPKGDFYDNSNKKESLSALNDSEVSFAYIADIIEQNYKLL